jgi:hypothetical protein
MLFHITTHTLIFISDADKLSVECNKIVTHRLFSFLQRCALPDSYVIMATDLFLSHLADRKKLAIFTFITRTRVCQTL